MPRWEKRVNPARGHPENAVMGSCTAPAIQDRLPQSRSTSTTPSTCYIGNSSLCSTPT